jgi:outer membrane protein assembly factor BamB/mono/diheme cytochrome c family protein
MKYRSAIVPAVLLGSIPCSLWVNIISGQTPQPDAIVQPNVTRTIHVRGYDWLQFGGNPQHDNFNRKEYLLGTSNVGGLKQLWQVSLPDPSDSEPVYLSDVETSAGVRDVVFVVTKRARLLAYDAHNGELIWQNAWDCCRESESGPAIDPNRKYIYVYGTDGYVHKASVYDGREIKGGGWPEVASPPTAEQGYSLGIATAPNGVTYLYANASQGIGHVTAINLADGAQKVFNFQNSDSTQHLNMPGGPTGHRGAAVWGRAGAVYDRDTDRVYFGTGTNSSTFDPVNHIWGGSLVALCPDGTSNRGNGYPVDSYTASNWSEQFRRDQDLGSTDPLVLPPVPGARFPHLALQSGKDGKIRVLNMDDLSGRGRAGEVGGELYITTTPQGRLRVMAQPALWINPNDSSVWVIFTSDSGIAALKVKVDSKGDVSLQPMWQQPSGVSTNQTVANGVVYYANGGGQSNSRTGTLFALSALTGDVLWSTPIASHHWASPIVANGILYNPDGRGAGRLTAYGLPGEHSQVLEAESLPVTSCTEGDEPHIARDPNESGGRGLLLEAKKPGDFLTVAVNIPAAGTYNVRIRGKSWKNRGIWQLKTDDVLRGSVDQYSPWEVLPETDLGNFSFSSGGAHSFTFLVTGKNAASAGYWVALDYIRLTEVAVEAHQAPSAGTLSVWNGVYTKEQARRGHTVYEHECASCHGADMKGSKTARPLVGDDFLGSWYGQSVGELFERIRASMPQGAPGRLSASQYADVVSHMLEGNGFPPGTEQLRSRVEVLKRIRIAKPAK